MLAKKFLRFQQETNTALPVSGMKKITYETFDTFIDQIFSVSALDLPDRIYCRDGFTYVNEIDYSTFQILTFQINAFGKGAFGDDVKKLCTPVLLTIKTHGNHRQATHSLADTSISIEDFYLGKNYCGSMGEKCKRDKITQYTKDIFLAQPSGYSYNHQIIYQLINTNYICHHVAETLSYAFSALDMYWINRQTEFVMVSASNFNESMHKMKIEIIENFSGDRMRNFFDIPHYVKLMENISKFKEEYGQMLWEVTYKQDIETFYLPVGFQKTGGKRFHKNINVITSQHILDNILKSYYRRKNSHVVSNTYQTLEFLSRGILAKMDGLDDTCREFLKYSSTCMGHYPEREFSEVLQKMKDKYHLFQSDFAHTNFFRPPVL
jgi:hypothetical protein